MMENDPSWLLYRYKRLVYILIRRESDSFNGPNLQELCLQQA